MKKERIWTVLMLGAVALIVVVVMLMEIIDRPDAPQESGIYKPTAAMTKSQSKYRNEDGSDSTYYGYYELKEDEKDESGAAGENAYEKPEVHVNQVIADLKSYDEKVNWGVKSATNDMKGALIIAGAEAITGDVSSAAEDVTNGIGNYLGDLYGALAP